MSSDTRARDYGYDHRYQEKQDAFVERRMSITGIVRCLTCGALVDECRREQHIDWHKRNDLRE